MPVGFASFVDQLICFCYRAICFRQILVRLWSVSVWVERQYFLYSGNRLLWPDAAKGFAIVLVVLAHLTSKHYSALDLEMPEVVHLFWLGLTDFLTPVRMPLFFAISGFFVASSLSKPWVVVWRKRIASTYYLYVVWYLIHGLFFQLDPPLATNLPSSLPEAALGLFWGFTSLWYLYALPLYFAICKMFSHYRFLSICAAVVLSIFSHTSLLPLIGNSGSVIQNLVFFMMAAYYPDFVRRISEYARRNLLTTVCVFSVSSGLMSMTTFIVLSYAVQSLAISALIGFADVVLGFLGILIGIKLFNVLVRKFGKVSGIFGYIGRNTLPIYVLHLPILAVLNLLFSDVSMPLAIGFVYPFAALFLVIILCLIFYRILLFLRLKVLFEMPLARRPVLEAV